MTGASTRGLLGRMIREEYRLHSELFGDRFAAFPLLVAAISGAGFWLLTLTDVGVGAVAVGVHGLVFFFGLQVGSIGLVGRDALRDVLGDVTLLVFSARTLPVTWRRLLAVFLLKDLLYYSVLFLGPLAAGYAVFAVTAGVPAGDVGLLYLTTAATFAYGAGTSLTAAGVATRSRIARLGLLVGAVAVTAATVAGQVDPVAVSPLAFYDSPSVATAAAGFGPVLALSVLGPLTFRPADGGTARSSPDRYSRVRAQLSDDTGVATRTMLEVARSSGSVWKVLFSMGVLFGVTALLVREVGRATALDPSPGIAFGTLLGLGAFTTYSWVTQFDDRREYLRYPLSMDAVFAGKRRAFLVLSVPAGYAYLALSLLWVPLTEVVLGAVVFPLVAVYVFGVTAYVTGLSPNELLFDTPLFAAFGAALALVSLPLVVTALTYTEAPTTSLAVALAVSVAGAVVGAALAGRAGPRWAATGR